MWKTEFHTWVPEVFFQLLNTHDKEPTLEPISEIKKGIPERDEETVSEPK